MNKCFSKSNLSKFLLSLLLCNAIPYESKATSIYSNEFLNSLYNPIFQQQLFQLFQIFLFNTVQQGLDPSNNFDLNKLYNQSIGKNPAIENYREKLTNEIRQKTSLSNLPTSINSITTYFSKDPKTEMIPLHEAVAVQNLKAVNTLLRKYKEFTDLKIVTFSQENNSFTTMENEEISIFEKNKMTLFHTLANVKNIFVYDEYKSILELLTKSPYGFDRLLFFKDSNNKTPIEIAFENNNKNIFKAFIEIFGIKPLTELRFGESENLIHHTLNSINENNLQKIINSFSNLLSITTAEDQELLFKLTDKNGAPAILKIAEIGGTLQELFIKQLKSKDNGNILHFLLEFDSITFEKFVKSMKIEDVNNCLITFNKTNQSPLEKIILQNDLEKFKILMNIAPEACLLSSFDNHETILHRLATNNGNIEMFIFSIETLRKLNVSEEEISKLINEKNSKGLSVLETAEENNANLILEYIENEIIKSTQESIDQ